jgi:hypothetical protein
MVDTNTHLQRMRKWMGRWLGHLATCRGRCDNLSNLPFFHHSASRNSHSPYAAQPTYSSGIPAPPSSQPPPLFSPAEHPRLSSSMSLPVTVLDEWEGDGCPVSLIDADVRLATKAAGVGKTAVLVCPRCLPVSAAPGGDG